MSANIGQIVAEITANTAGLRRGVADAQRILNDTSNNASVAGKAIGVAFAVTAALGVMKLIDKLEDCTQVAIDNKKALMGLESVASRPPFVCDTAVYRNLLNQDARRLPALSSAVSAPSAFASLE